MLIIKKWPVKGGENKSELLERHHSSFIILAEGVFGGLSSVHLHPRAEKRRRKKIKINYRL